MSKNQIIISIIVVIVIVGGLILLGKPATQNNQQANLDSVADSALATEETAFDFGSISMAAGNVNHEFKIKNSGAEPVTIEKLYTSCMCTTVKFIQGGKEIGPFGMPGHGFVPPLKKTVAPNEEVTVSVTFDPTAHGPAGVGLIERAVYLYGKSDLLLQLNISASVTP